MVLISLTCVFYACNVAVYPDDGVQNIEQLRTEIANRFGDLETALRSSKASTIDRETFKKESLKHLLKVDETSENYMQISENYDLGYLNSLEAQSFKEKNETKNHSAHLIALSENLVSTDSFQESIVLFNDFYMSIDSDRDLSSDEKNILISKVAWYEGALLFFEQNHELFLSDAQNKSITNIQFKGCGWWQRWGKCAAGTLGSALTGGLGGCGGGAAVAAIPTLGVGAAPACIGGAIVGGIAGGLTGAAAFCDGCDEEVSDNEI